MNHQKLLSKLGNEKIRIKRVIKSLKNGNGAIIVDKESRENESDIVFSAEKMTVTQMAFSIRYGSGIVCLSLTPDYCEKLNLSMMVNENTNIWKTGFTVTIEASSGITTGVSAKDRLETIKRAISDNAKPSDLNRPGHVFPLRAHPGGIIARSGHTEATIELMKIAGLKPAAVLCELTNLDGSMANIEDALLFSKKHNIPIISIYDIILYKYS